MTADDIHRAENDTPWQSYTRARVYLRDTPAGLLEKVNTKLYRFTYDTAYLNNEASVPIARTFPLRKSPFDSENELHPFFDNLILEGWLLGRAEKLFQIDKKNRFALLMLVGRYPIGAISVAPIETTQHETEGEEVSPPKLPNRNDHIPFPITTVTCKTVGNTKSKINRTLWGTSRKLTISLLKDSPLETFSATIYGGSISGAQRKGLFSLDRKTGLLFPEIAQSEYIVKPDGVLPELPANEHITMTIASELAFQVPPFALLHSEKIGYIFVIQRFDRHKNRKLMLEDMGQLLGRASEDKYFSSMENVVKAIERHVQAARLAKNRLFRRVLFCYFIANGDMHLKNWSLLESPDSAGTLSLSPCYDFLNTRTPLPHEEFDIALTIRGKKKGIQPSYLRKFAKETLNLSDQYIESVFEELPEWWKITERAVGESFLSESFKERYLEIVSSRYEILSN
jgi:serine/threonine-protein kinase HipA